MKLYLILITVFLLSYLHNYEVEGIRLGKVTLPVINHHEIIKMLSIIGRKTEDHELLDKTDALPSGFNRKLMTKTKSSSTTATISENQKHDGNQNDPKQEIESVHGSVGKEDNFLFSLLPENLEHGKEVDCEPYPNDTEIMDYTPTRKKTPIHN